MTTKTTTMTLALMTLAFGACSDEAPQAGIAVQAVTSNTDSSETLVMTDEVGTEYGVSQAHLILRHIELDLPDGRLCSDLEDSLDEGVGCEVGDSEDKLHIEGPFRVNLITGESVPSLEGIMIPTGVYKRIDFRVADDVGDEAFSVTSTMDYEGASLTFNLSLDFNEDIRIESQGGVNVEEGQDLLLSFVAKDWLSGIDLLGCIDNGDVELDGTSVTIGDGSSGGACSDIEGQIKENMKLSGQFDKQ